MIFRYLPGHLPDTAERACQTETLDSTREKINLLATAFDVDGIAKFADDIAEAFRGT
jgi:hypothetical protein